MKSVLVLLSLVFILSPAFGATPDTLIVPGTRVGEARLGEQFKSLSKRLGKGEVFRQGPFLSMAFKGYIVTFGNPTPTGTVESIVVTDPPYKLKNGLGIGATEADVRKFMGAPQKVQELKAMTKGQMDRALSYSTQGVAFSLAKGKVIQIVVFKKLAK